MSDTMGSMAVEVTRNLRGDLQDTDGQQSIRDFINSANESIWMSMMKVHVARFYGQDSPVSFQLATNTERIKLVTIQDPAVPLLLNTVAGGALGNRTIFCYYSFVTESGSETLVDAGTAIAPAPGQLIQVTQQLQVGTAFGWNLYTAPQGQSPGLANQNPLPFGVPFLEPVTGFQGYPNYAQPIPLVNTTGDNISWIKQLEIRTSDQLLRSWDQYDLGSETFRRMGRVFPSASEYASYVWELTGNGTLEFRPMTGMGFNPRYWYVARPRRIRYDQADLPYTAITGVHEFIYHKVMAECKFILDEYIASDKFKAMSDQDRMEVQTALLEEQWSKNTRISPYLF